MKKRENFPQKNLGDFFSGGRIQGDVCVGGLLGNKRPDRGKKISGGQKTFWGNAKKGWKNFLGECWGSCEPPKILGGNFLKNVKEKNWGGNFGG